MAFHTLTYSDGVKGWTSFFSYYPDWMIGMNQFFYTFNQGRLFRHNSNNAPRNTFYGFFEPTQMISVFNEAPIDNKLFKTINLESTDEWSAILETDIQTSGFINADWFEKKEGSYFAFIRNSGEMPADITEYNLRSLNGLGLSTSVAGTTNTPIINFAASTNIGTIISIGDVLYYAAPPYDNPILAGRITQVNVNLQANPQVNQIVIDATMGGSVTPAPIPIQNGFYLFIKDSVAESHGVLGHYCKFTIRNTNTNPIELFVVEADVMKSFP